MVRVKKKFLKVRETSGNLNRGKLMSWRKVRENWNHLIETFEVTLISTIFLLNEIGKFVENVLVLMNDWKDDCNLKPEATTTYDIFSQGNINFNREKSGCLWQPWFDSLVLRCLVILYLWTPANNQELKNTNWEEYTEHCFRLCRSPLPVAQMIDSLSMTVALE